MDLNKQNGFEMLKEEITYAYENVLYYSNLMNEINLRPKSIKYKENIKLLPISYKKDYIKNYPVGTLAKGFSLNDKEIFRSQSSGTLGERLLSCEKGILLLQRAFDCLKANPSIMRAFIQSPRKHCRFASPNCSDVECSSLNSSMNERILKDGTLILSVYHDLLTTPQELLNQCIEEILQYKPQLYIIDPTHFAFLLKNFKKQNIEPPAAPILSTYTACTNVAKRQITRMFPEKTTFSELISMTELGWIALECSNHQLHLNNQSYYLELISNGKDVEHSGIGELVISSLFRGASPHIRYNTGDLYRIADMVCICGSKYPVVSMEGRTRNSIFRKNKIFITPKQLDNIIGDFRGFDLYQMYQQDEDLFHFSYIKNDCFCDNEFNELKKRLSFYLGKKTVICFVDKEYIPTDRTGKFQFCLSDLAQKHVLNGTYLT